MMQPETSLRNTLGFSSRADQIFGSLGGSSLDGASASKNAPWTVSQDTVFRSSKEAYSSDEDEEAKEIDRRQKEIMPESMQELEDDELGGEAFRPSAAFCRALDNEQEYDSIDAVAMAGDHGEPLPGLASTTEVLDDNIYEQRARRRIEAGEGEARNNSHSDDVHQASGSAMPLSVAEKEEEDDEEEEGIDGNVDSMETDEEPASGSRLPSSMMEKSRGAKLAPALKSSKPEDSTVEAQAVLSSADEDEQQRSKKKKKVHFQMDKPWVPPHRRSSDWGDRPRSITASEQDAAGPSGSGGPTGQQRRRSFVPDHVKNPERYTCYDLGESILVGGGEQGSGAADGGKAEMERAARAASSAAARTPLVEEAGDQDEERELPAFGSGLEFRPQGKLAASKGGAAAAEAARRANDGSLAISLEEETEEVVEDDMGDAEQDDAGDLSKQSASANADESMPAGGRPRAQRNFRSKA